MILSTRHRAGLAVLVALASAACGSADVGNVSDSTDVPRDLLEEFLRAQHFDTFDTAAVNRLSLEECDPVGAVEPLHWLVAARVLDSLSNSDTVAFSAEIVTLASEVTGMPPTIREVQVQMAVDTTSWRLVRARTGEHWRVCGISADGFSFVGLGDTSTIRLSPISAAIPSLRLQADSIRRVIGTR